MFNDLDVILSEGEGYTIEFKESADKTLVTEVCHLQMHSAVEFLSE